MPALADASLIAAQRRMLDRFVEGRRERLGDRLVSIRVFGSRARGAEAGTEFDVDVPVVTRGGRADESAVRPGVSPGLGRRAGTPWPPRT